MSDIQDLTTKVINFRDKRDWKQFHNPKDCGISLLLEVSELLEHFQWKNAEILDKHIRENKKEISKELADVFYWVLLISHDLNIDISKSLILKIKENQKKYPISKSKGKSTKYNKL